MLAKVRNKLFSSQIGYGTLARPLVLLLLAATMPAGCVSAPDNHRVARYRPQVSDAERSPWRWSGTQNWSVNNSVASRPTSQAIPAARDRGKQSANSPAVSPVHDVRNQKVRRLKKGDTVYISLMGIQEPVKIQEIVDDDGNIKIQYLGNVFVEGKSTSEAEKYIEQLYIENDIYVDLNVVIIVEKETFFIRGEVKTPGKYELAPGMTLLQAIATAAGFTDYAKEKRIQITRGNRNYLYNAVEINEGKAPDPAVEDGDIIVVERSIIGLN